MKKNKTREIICVAIIGAILAVLVDYLFKPAISKNVRAAMRVP